MLPRLGARQDAKAVFAESPKSSPVAPRQFCPCGPALIPMQVTVLSGVELGWCELDVGFGLLDQAPELKTLNLDGFFDCIAGEVMGRRLVRPNHASNGPGTMFLREFASHRITGEGVQLISCLGLKDIDAHDSVLSPNDV